VFTSWKYAYHKNSYNSNNGKIIKIVDIPQSISKRVPYVGPVLSTARLILDVRDISTPIDAIKIISARIAKECTLPDIFWQVNFSGGWGWAYCIYNHMR